MRFLCMSTDADQDVGRPRHATGRDLCTVTLQCSATSVNAGEVRPVSRQKSF